MTLTRSQGELGVDLTPPWESRHRQGGLVGQEGEDHRSRWRMVSAQWSTHFFVYKTLLWISISHSHETNSIDDRIIRESSTETESPPCLHSSSSLYTPGGFRFVVFSSACKCWLLAYFYKINCIVFTFCTVTSIIIVGAVINLSWSIIRRNFTAISLLHWFALAWFRLWWRTNAVSVPFFDSIPASARALRPGLPLVPMSLNEERRLFFDKIGLFGFRALNTASQRKLHTVTPDQLTFVLWQKASIRAGEVAFHFIYWFAMAWFCLWWGTNAVSVPYFDSHLTSTRALRPGLPLVPISLIGGRER